jgi:hypothetical protein
LGSIPESRIKFNGANMSFLLIDEQPITLYFTRIDYVDWKTKREKFEMKGPYRFLGSAKGQATKQKKSLENIYSHSLRMIAKIDGVEFNKKNISYDDLNIKAHVITYHLFQKDLIKI